MQVNWIRNKITTTKIEEELTLINMTISKRWSHVYKFLFLALHTFFVSLLWLVCFTLLNIAHTILVRIVEFVGFFFWCFLFILMKRVKRTNLCRLIPCLIENVHVLLNHYAMHSLRLCTIYPPFNLVLNRSYTLNRKSLGNLWMKEFIVACASVDCVTILCFS